MAIRLPNDLPARRIVEVEGLRVLDPVGPARRNQPDLRIGLLNLMPEKCPTEIQFARHLGRAGYDVELTLMVPDSYRSKTTPEIHLARFYERFGDVADQDFDGLIVTGAPIETLAFEEVTYWEELKRTFDWATRRTQGALYVCWAAQAALYHFHGVPKHSLRRKRFGIFEQQVVAPNAPLMEGLGDVFPAPVSRHTEVREADLPTGRGIEVLARSRESGLCLLQDAPRHSVYMFNHLEYDRDTLKREYFRDLAAGRAVSIPRNYFRNDDPGSFAVDRWRPHARLFFTNWLAGLAQRAAGRQAREERAQPLPAPWFADQALTGSSIPLLASGSSQ